MKILITTEFYLPTITGVVTAVLNQRSALLSRGHDVRILTISSNNTSYEEDGVYYIRSNKLKIYPDSNSTFAFNDPLLDEIYAWSPDIVHSQCEFFTMIFAKKISRKLDIPLVHTCHTDFESYGVYFIKNQKLWHSFISRLIRGIMKRIDCVVCPTSKNKEMLESYKVRPELIVLPVGLRLEMFAQKLASSERSSLRKKYGIQDDEQLLVSICRLGPEKNVGEVIEDFALLKKVLPKTKLLVVGDGTDKSNLEQMVEDLGLQQSVVFTGSVPIEHVWKYFKLGEVYVSASKSEIQGLTYIEALASGQPIVCRWDESLRNTLVEGENGFSFFSSKGFLEKMQLVLSDATLHRKLVANSVPSIQKYSNETFGQSLEALYIAQIAKKHTDTQKGI